MPTTINYTDIYKFFFLGPGTETQRYPNADQERWEAAEVQLLELYTMFGNGVSDGWEIATEVARGTSGPRIWVTSGDGHVYFKYAETTSNTAIDLTVPSGINLRTDPVTYYVYGEQTETTHYDKSIDFKPYTAPQDDEAAIYLGRFTLGMNDSGDYVITSIDYTNRDTISIFSTLSDLIKNHVHLGGTNPPKINLRRHVAGVLPGEFIESSLNASQVTMGKFNADRLPQIDHSTLSNNGTLTHSQIDTMLATLQTDDYERLDDVTRVNLLKMVIGLKKKFFDIDETLINAFAYNPGYTDDSFVDLTRTTAVIDSEEQQIVGILASPATSDFASWSGSLEMTAAYAKSVTPANDGLVVNDDGELELEVPLNFRAIHARSGSGALDWEVHTKTTAQDADAGGTVPINVQVEMWQFQRFRSGSNFIPQNWSNINKLQFGFDLVDPDLVEHGDIYFFLIGADLDSGTSTTVSYTPNGSSTTYSLKFSEGVKILDSEVQTSEYPDGILPVSIDLLQWSDRRTILGYGFYVSTEHGWVPSDSFEFELHQPRYSDMSNEVSDHLQGIDPYSVGDEGNITLYGYNDLYHTEEGRIIFRFNQTITTEWDYVYWGSTIPAVDDDVTEPRITVYTRSANTEAALPFQPESLVPESNHRVAEADSKYIDVTVKLRASSNLEETPQLSSLTLYYTVASSSNSKSYSTQDELEAGLTQTNISILTNPDRMEMADASLVNAIFFLEGDEMRAIDDDLSAITSLNFDGSNLYLTPRQAFAKVGAGYRGPTSVQVLENGHYVITDTKNDRVVEVDSDGELHRAVQGNVYLAASNRDFVALTSYYNSRLGEIYVCFSQNIAADIQRDKFTLTTKDRTNSIQFLTDNDATFSTFVNPDGKSAVLVIKLTATRKTQVDSWTGNKQLMISSGGVNSASSSSSSSDAEFSEDVELMASTSEDTPMMQASRNLDVALNLLDNELGALSEFTPSTSLDTTTSTTADETTSFDYDGDGNIRRDTLMGVDEETSLMTVDVDDVDVVFANLRYPIYAENAGENNYIIAQAYSVSVLNIGIDSEVIWSLTNEIVSFDSQKPGIATLLSSGNVLCASPTMNKVLEVVPSTEAIIFSHTPHQTAMYAHRLSSGNTVVVESDEAEGGINSRVYEMDVNQDVIREWGIGRLQQPTGVSVLESGNWLISC